MPKPPTPGTGSGTGAQSRDRGGDLAFRALEVGVGEFKDARVRVPLGACISAPSDTQSSITEADDCALRQDLNARALSETESESRVIVNI